MDLTVLMVAMPSAPPRFAASATSHITNIWCHFSQHWQGRTAFNRPTVFSTNSGLCPTSLPIACEVICGQEKLHSIISAPASSTSGPVPAIAAHFPHDRRNQDLIRVVLFQSPNSSQILLQRMLGNLLHVLKPIKPVSSLLRWSKRGETSFAIKNPIVLKQCRPNRYHRLWRTFHSSCPPERKRQNGLGNLTPQKVIERSFVNMSKLPLNSDEWPERLLFRFSRRKRPFYRLQQYRPQQTEPDRRFGSFAY